MSFIIQTSIVYVSLGYWLLALGSSLIFELQFTIEGAYLLNFITFFWNFIYAVQLFTAEALVKEVLFFVGLL
jgi:hypothetical protein